MVKNSQWLESLPVQIMQFWTSLIACKYDSAPNYSFLIEKMKELRSTSGDDEMTPFCWIEKSFDESIMEAGSINDPCSISSMRVDIPIHQELIKVNFFNISLTSFEESSACPTAIAKLLPTPPATSLPSTFGSIFRKIRRIA